MLPPMTTPDHNVAVKLRLFNYYADEMADITLTQAVGVVNDIIFRNGNSSLQRAAQLKDTLLLAGYRDNRPQHYNLVGQALEGQMLGYSIPQSAKISKNGIITDTASTTAFDGLMEALRRSGIFSVYSNSPTKSSLLYLDHDSARTAHLVMKLGEIFLGEEWVIIHALRVRALSESSPNSQTIARCAKCTHSAISFEHLMTCRELKHARATAMINLTRKLQKWDVFQQLSHCQRSIPAMKEAVSLLTQQLAQDYSDLTKPIQKKLTELDIDSVTQIPGVLDSTKILRWKSWNNQVLVDQVTKNCSKRNDCRHFSLDNRFLQLTRIITTVKQCGGITKIPTLGEIHDYIATMHRDGTLFLFHSPRFDEPEIVSSFRLLFLVEYLKVIPNVIREWLRTQRE
jgi:hypothetical protein